MVEVKLCLHNLPNASINGSLLPASLLNTILILHCWFNDTDTDPVIFIGLGGYSTCLVLLYTAPVPLQCIVIVTFSGASPVHFNVTYNNIVI